MHNTSTPLQQQSILLAGNVKVMWKLLQYRIYRQQQRYSAKHIIQYGRPLVETVTCDVSNTRQECQPLHPDFPYIPPTSGAATFFGARNKYNYTSANEDNSFRDHIR